MVQGRVGVRHVELFLDQGPRSEPLTPFYQALDLAHNLDFNEVVSANTDRSVIVDPPPSNPAEEHAGRPTISQ